ncbi:MAG: hypothetical protein BGP13_08220 [Sphingobacteriales bacterium 40-81]|nr:MAG: hypothetical protein BGP13_08220 [Sphingobacteriales bacterium 40-81]
MINILASNSGIPHVRGDLGIKNIKELRNIKTNYPVSLIFFLKDYTGYAIVIRLFVFKNMIHF